MLSVSNLVKRYGAKASGFVAVADVSFEIREGEFFTLLGPSGCGKTTTLRSIAGLEMPDDGEIRIAGEAVFRGRPRLVVPPHRRDIAMVFQSYAIWPHMTVYENVAFPLEARDGRRNDQRDQVMGALGMVGLETFAQRSATLLSGGQQQRVALARAIVKGAKLLLLDEPLSNLDAKLREQMRAELRDLQRRLGTTTVYVTHDQDEALSLSDRIAVMDRGRIVELDSPLNLYLRPRTAFTARFIGQADLLPCSVSEFTADACRIDTPLGRLESRACPQGVRGEAALLIRPEHVELADVEATDGRTNCLAGTIQTASFSGRLVEYVIAIGSERLRVQSTSTTIRRGGDRVTVRLPPDRCVVLQGPAS